MFSANVVAIILATIATKSVVAADQVGGVRLEFRLELAPLHGLPGIPPSMKITATNLGDTPVVVPGASLRLEAATPDGKSFIVDCDGDGPCGDFQNAWFDGPPRSGAFTLTAGKPRCFLIGTVMTRSRIEDSTQSCR